MAYEFRWKVGEDQYGVIIKTDSMEKATEIAVQRMKGATWFFCREYHGGPHLDENTINELTSKRKLITHPSMGYIFAVVVAATIVQKLISHFFFR